MLTDADAEKAADFLRDNAAEFGRLRGERVYLEEFRKSLKATLMASHNGLSAALQEREAYRDQTYKDHLVKLRDAVTAEETARAMRVAAEMKIEVWRTQAANQRGRI